MPPPKSKAWAYFSKKENSIAQCKLCLKQVKFSGNTSNMLKHLKLHHAEQFNDNKCDPLNKNRINSR